MSLINVTASGSTIQKTGGCGGCADASAVSQGEINGTGALTFVASDSGALRFVGLGSGGIGTGAGDINFAIRLQAGVAEVREAGAYKTETSFSAGDRFQIAVNGGVVTYAKNGAVFYTSGSQAGYAVRVHAVFFDLNGAVANVAVSGASGGAAAPAPPSASAPTTSETRYAQPRPSGSTPKRRRPSYR
jgi:hypothetical protein